MLIKLLVLYFTLFTAAHASPIPPSPGASDEEVSKNQGTFEPSSLPPKYHISPPGSPGYEYTFSPGANDNNSAQADGKGAQEQQEQETQSQNIPKKGSPRRIPELERSISRSGRWSSDFWAPRTPMTPPRRRRQQEQCCTIMKV